MRMKARLALGSAKPQCRPGDGGLARDCLVQKSREVFRPGERLFLQALHSLYHAFMVFYGSFTYAVIMSMLAYHVLAVLPPSSFAKERC